MPLLEVMRVRVVASAGSARSAGRPGVLNPAPASFILLYMSNYQIKDVDRYAAIFKALSNPNRLRIYLDLLDCCEPGTFCRVDGGFSKCVGELARGLAISPSTMSHHIKELGRAGLLRMERQGRAVRCSIDQETLRIVLELFKEATG